MNKTYRFLGRNGRTIIPIQIRRMLNIGRGDLIGYSIQGNTVVVTKEKVCNNCRKEHDSVQEMAEQLTPQERREMLSYLMKKARREKC